MTQTAYKTEYDKLFIGGKWVEPSTSEVIEVHSPATGAYGGKVPLAPNYLLYATEDSLVLRNYEGKLYRYPDPILEPQGDTAVDTVDQTQDTAGLDSSGALA